MQVGVALAIMETGAKRSKRALNFVDISLQKRVLGRPYAVEMDPRRPKRQPTMVLRSAVSSRSGVW